VSNRFWGIIYLKGNTLVKFYYTIIGYLKRIISLFQIGKYDIVYVHLWVTPFGLPIFEWIYTKLSKKIIYDIDDMVFLGHSSDANSFIQSLKGKRKMIYLMKKANHVITCTPKLDEFVRKYNSKTTDISSTVDTNSRYLKKTDYSINNELVIGWSGSHSTSKYLYLLDDVLKRLSEKYKFKLLVMGDASFNIEGINVEAKEWKEEYEIDTLKQFDIGLYPLPNEDWVYGKSGLKAIQYMALGIPTVATAIGANFRIIENEKNGFLIEVDDEKSWYNRIEQLILSEELREKLGKAGRKIIVEKYSIEANKQKYLDVFNSVLEL
jgi:glycosyltransferase involved in cell wall biosynthesis